MKFNNLDEVFEYLDTLNDAENDLCYDDCKNNSYVNIAWYEEFLKEVLKDKPKRVIDVGSNLNQYGFLFANEGIEYIGIDLCTAFPCDGYIMQPLIAKNIKYIQSDYKLVREYFKDDVIISCLCIGYLIPLEEVKAKKIIINGIDENKKMIAKVCVC